MLGGLDKTLLNINPSSNAETIEICR